MPTVSSDRRRAKPKSQTQRILEYLESGKSISPLEALTVFGCTRLAARIYDIEEKFGIAVDRIDRRDASGKRYSRYRLKGS